MRDLDRFEKRKVVRRVDRYDSEPNFKVSWLGTLSRLLVVIVAVLFLGWGIWEIYQPANVWITQTQIRQTEADVRIVHEEAEKARKEMEAPRPVTVESLIYQVTMNDYVLTEDERNLVKQKWEYFLGGSQISDPDGLLFRMRMRIDENGEIADIPEDEWEEEKARLEKKRSENTRTLEMQAMLQESGMDIASQEAAAAEKKTKAIDEQKKRLYDRRENRGLIGEIANEINESFYAGESPYEEKEEDSDIFRPREEEEVNEADDSAAASDEPEAQDEERKVSEDERGERSAESLKPGNSEAAGDLVNQNEESLKKKESENESGKNE